jgi:hypothetical protein
VSPRGPGLDEERVGRLALDHLVFERREELLVGEVEGVTKERIRQLESRALDKARQAAAEEHIELPD